MREAPCAAGNAFGAICTSTDCIRPRGSCGRCTIFKEKERGNMRDVQQRRQFAFVVRQLTAREIKRKYARSYLGIVWSVLNPLLSMAVLSLIFSQLFRRSIENYPIYYLTGYILWQTFTGATTAAMTTLADNKMLLLKVKFPMDLFILTRVYTALINLGYSLVAYVLMLAVFQVTFKWTMLFSPVIILCLIVFSLGISYMLATAYVFFGDIKHLYSVVLTLWMYCSAIFYPVEQLQGLIRVVIWNNPLYTYIHCLRKAVMYGALPDAVELLQMILWAAAIYGLGYGIFRRCRSRILQKI